ncbi:MAG TPA: hypothetical protein VGH85_23985 [Mycobacteriales bacterium]
MSTDPSATADLFARAEAARAGGSEEAASRLYDEAATRCRAEDDLEGWTRAVLGAASVQVFGSEPGKVPALLYDVLARTTDDGSRSRLAAALARCWVYAGQAARAAPFADEAVERAQRVGDPGLTADALDAALAVHWGPDELGVRRSLASRLDDVAAHVLDTDARLQAHLWGLQVACEALDLQAMYRQIRALELLGAESPRALFFAASRRQMLDLMRGRTDTATHLQEVAAAAGERSRLADAWMVVKAMACYSAAQSGDVERCAAGAQDCEEFAVAEGVITVCAEAAYLWVAARRPDRARALVSMFHGDVLDDLPRDVNWLLTLQCVLEAALAVDDRAIVVKATGLLGPYDGRAVFNAGAVMFHGTTDDTLSRAYAALGDTGRAEELRLRALATYERIGAPWWHDRLASWSSPGGEPIAVGAGRMHLHPTPGGLWLIGRPGTPVAGLRGYGYLRELIRRPGQPVSALDLVGAGTGVVAAAGLGDVADRQALAAYRQRLRDLDDELAEAEAWADTGRIAAARSEREALLDELGRTTGLGGRARTSGSSQERARVAVRKAITAALDRITTVDDALARHLRRSIRTGLVCNYEPDADDEMDWALD